MWTWYVFPVKIEMQWVIMTLQMKIITFSPLPFTGSFRSEGIKASDVLLVLREKIAFVSGECEMCVMFWACPTVVIYSLTHFENEWWLTLGLPHLALVLVVHPATVCPDLLWSVLNWCWCDGTLLTSMKYLSIRLGVEGFARNFTNFNLWLFHILWCVNIWLNLVCLFKHPIQKSKY